MLAALEEESRLGGCAEENAVHVVLLADATWQCSYLLRSLRLARLEG
jgi:hypothetical protein